MSGRRIVPSLALLALTPLAPGCTPRDSGPATPDGAPMKTMRLVWRCVDETPWCGPQPTGSGYVPVTCAYFPEAWAPAAREIPGAITAGPPGPELLVVQLPALVAQNAAP